MEKWNIVSVFDSSSLKVNQLFKGFIIKDISDIRSHYSEADVLVVLIPSEDEAILNAVLYNLGWDKEIVHAGKYKEVL